MTFADQMLEDLDVFTNPDEHGTTALLDGVEVSGVYEVPSAEDLQVAGTTPTYSGSSSALQAAQEDQTLTITSGPDAGLEYRVVIARPDGTGWTTIELEST